MTDLEYSSLKDEEYRALLDLHMVNDPWPLEEKQQESVRGLLNREAEVRNYGSWVVAYHELELEKDD